MQPITFYGDGAMGDRIFKQLGAHADHDIEIIRRGGGDVETEAGLAARPQVITLECVDCGQTIIEATE